jgi:outer membrane DcaP-like protein
MNLFKTLVCLSAVAFFACAAPTSLYSQDQNTNQPQTEVLQKQLDDLRAQMADIQDQIKKLSAAPAQAATAAPQAPTKPDQVDAETELKSDKQQQVGKATSQYETFSQDPLAAPRMDNAPLDPRYPGYFRLPGTRTFLRIGGYFKSDFIYDLKPAGDAERFIPSTIPVPAPPGVNNSTVSVRPTRINLDFLIPTESVDTIRFFLEGDLFGSNSTTPRMRHAYAQVKNLLLGQSFSNFMDPDSGPDQLEFQGPNGQVSIRNPQIRYAFKLGKKTSLSFAVEKPSSDVSFKTTDSVSAVPNTPSPDGTVKLRHDMESGHVQLSALFRSVAAFLPDGRSDAVFGWGINFTGSQRLIGKDTFVYQGAYGYGIERYLNDTSGLGIDAGVEDANSPHLKALPVVGTYGAYQHFWFSRLRSSAIYGFAQVQNSDLQTDSSFHRSHYTAANLIWNPIGSLHLGTEFLYGWQVKKDGTSGNAPRFMFSAKYNFVQMKAPEKKAN